MRRLANLQETKLIDITGFKALLTVQKNDRHLCDITLNTDKIKHLKLFSVHLINTACA